LKKVYQQVEEGRCKMSDCQGCLKEVASRVEKNMMPLKRVDEKLLEHQQSCEHVKVLTEECILFIKTEDVDLLEGYRDRRVKARDLEN
jgi:hypothetical protein